MPFALLTGQAGLEWWDLAVIVGLYLLLAIPFPGLVLRPFFWLATRTIYRIRARGMENVPKTGPVLLLCNHVTYVDWLLIWAVCPRQVRFVAWAGWTKNPLFRWFLRVTNSILVDGEGGPRQLVRSLQQITAALDRGECICLFPEGALTRGGGVMLPFRRGFERIVAQAKSPVPIVPVCLSQLWGSIFSYSGGRVLWKLPEQVPYRVSVTFGKPLPPSTTAPEVRLVIQEMAADAYTIDSDSLRPVHRQFLRNACRFSKMFRVAWIDATTGTPRVLSYLKAMVGSMCMAKWLRPRIGSEQCVGIWLPTGLGSALANVALNLLGRTTVNLNYTAGKDSNESAVRQTGLKTVVTARRFLDRMPFPLEGLNIILLEDALKQITRWSRIRSLLTVLLLPGWFVERFVWGLGRHRMDDVATIIFSSGSTGEPKGVPLTYRNLTTNSVAGGVHLGIVISDRLMASLPFFHSFGYTVTLWLPLQVGASAVFYPDPRQAKEIGEICRTQQCTALLGTATFLRFYLRRCQLEDFKTIRIIVCGAEKLPPSLAKEFEAKFGVLPMEGYGCTELSPIVAVSVPDAEVKGIKQVRNKVGYVGHPIPGVACRLVDPDTGEPLPFGQEGLVEVKGPNVMPGYLNRPDLTAKVLKNGWYNTGDMGRIDEDGFVAITGRVSRFAKIGGEMIPLEKLEDDMHAALGTADRVLAVAAVPDDRRGERLIVLHLPTMTITPRELASRLQERGVPNLWVPSDRDYFLVQEMPVLGSGKIDLKRLKELATELAR